MTGDLKPLSHSLPKRAHLKLVSSAAEIMQDPPRVGDKTFAPRLLAITTFPHQQPKGNPEAWTRRNGRALLTVRPGWDAKAGKRLPYPAGSIPRLLTVYLCREAKRADAKGDKSGRIDLGNSLTAFMLELGLNPSNGSSRAKRSDAARLRKGMSAFFEATISYHEELSGPDAQGLQWHNMQIAPKGVLWWDTKQPDQPTLWGSWIQLSPDFREALIATVIPLDMRALRALKASPLAIDLYIWLCHESGKAQRTGKGRFVAWSNLMEQFGAQYADPKDFGKWARVALRKVKALYPQLRLRSLRGGITIDPSTRPAIEPREPLMIAHEAGKTL
jgi:Plasmid encoded RepA protein